MVLATSYNLQLELQKKLAEARPMDSFSKAQIVFALTPPGKILLPNSNRLRKCPHLTDVTELW